MSDDPETARQIAELARDTRPLLVVDVDDVLIEFIRPFSCYLDRCGHDLKLDSFRLNGNIIERRTKLAVEQAGVAALIAHFFDTQADWQAAAPGAVQALKNIAQGAEIVMLTAMPHRHRSIRRRHLDTLGFPYPLLTTEKPKGPAISMLRGDHARPVAFVDDIPSNLASVRAALPDAHLFHLMAMPSLRALLAPLEDGVCVVEDWREAEPRIAAALGL